MDSNKFLFKSLLHYIAEAFLATATFKKTSKESILEAIPLLQGARGQLCYQFCYKGSMNTTLRGKLLTFGLKSRDR